MDKNKDFQSAIDSKYDEVVQYMTTLGTYKPEFDDAIRVYVHMIVQYDTIYSRWVRGGMKSKVKSSGGYKRSPEVAQLEELRKQMVTYSDRLGLTPKALDTIKNNVNVNVKTGLDKAMETISGILDNKRDD